MGFHSGDFLWHAETHRKQNFTKLTTAKPFSIKILQSFAGHYHLLLERFCSKIDLIDQMGLGILQHFPTDFSTWPLDACFIEVWENVLLFLCFSNLLKLDSVLLFTKLEVISMHNLPQSKITQLVENPFSTWYHLHLRMSPWWLINKCSPISAFQRLRIYSPSSDAFWSVFHILSDPSALIAFAGRSG